MKKLAVVGFGRFGELFAQLARESYEIIVIDTSDERQAKAREHGYKIGENSDIAEVVGVVLAVPISMIEDTVKSITPYVTPAHTVMDVCSVKVYPSKVMQEHLGDCHIVATHPMFGPDSAARGLTHLKVAFCPIRVTDETADEWRAFWRQNGVDVIETTPDEHDRQAAYSQALPYTIAHILNGMNLPPLTFTTRSSEALYDIAKYSAKDTAQLFSDMLAYNPYAKQALQQFEASIQQTFEMARPIVSSK